MAREQDYYYKIGQGVLWSGYKLTFSQCSVELVRRYFKPVVTFCSGEPAE